jgi:methylmalonyl-CoA/ethylmalonyl-CoA epimerase
MLTGINHIGIAVKDLEASKQLFAKIFQVSNFHTETVADQKVSVASFKVGDVLIELTMPTDPESPIAKFIEKKGEGIHHVAFDTENATDELARLSGDGVRLIDEKPRPGAHGKMIAFLHPKSTNGVLMEVCQDPK